jgi:hypothetical protein
MKDKPPEIIVAGPDAQPEESNMANAEEELTSGVADLRASVLAAVPEDKALIVMGSVTRVEPHHSKIVDTRADGSSIVYIKVDPFYHGKPVERRIFDGQEFQESIELSAHKDGGKFATVVKPVQTRDETIVYVSLGYRNSETAPSGYGYVEKTAGKPLLPDIQASFVSRRTANGLRPEDLYLKLSPAGQTGRQIVLKEVFKEAGIRASGKGTWRWSSGDRAPFAVEMRDDTFVIKLNDHFPSGEVEFPKEIDFESLYEKWSERFSS